MFGKFVQTKTTYDAQQKIWLGPKTLIDPAAMQSIGKVILDSLLADPEHISQICDNNGKQYTNKDIATLSVRCAQHFKKLGFKQCDVFGICASNTDYLAPLFFGGMLSGLTASPLDTSFDKNGIKHIFSITKPKIMFCDGLVYETVQAVLDELNFNIPVYTMKDHMTGVKTITDFIEPAENETDFKLELLEQGVSQTAVILCSSGTTGPPKGVCVSHESVLRNKVFSMDSSDKVFCFSSLFWLSAIFVLANGTIQGATRVITDKSFNPNLFLNIISKHNITVTSTPPSQLAICLALPDIKEANLSSLEAYLCGGSSVPFAYVTKIRTLQPDLKLYVGYGMSEMSAIVAMGEVQESGAVGQLLANFEVKIINDRGENLGPNKVGEICIKIPFKWHGYYDNPGATNDIYDQDGWIHSGDLGSFNETCTLSIVGRIKDIMKYNNFHFSPSEIEEIICQLPGVAEVCVCGIPNIIATYLPAAAIVKVADSNLNEDDICNFVSKKLPHFNHLHGGVYFLDSIPKTPSGKNLRSKVQNICENLRNCHTNGDRPE